MEEFAPEKKSKYIDFYMKIVHNVAEMSYAKRLKVGSILVKNDSIISYGWNGTPAGWDNNCENEENENGQIILKTKAEVMHSEMNCISKVAKSNISAKNSTMFLSHAPCVQCAKLIYGAGITSVYFRNHYRNQDGLEFLKKCKINVNEV